VSASTSSTDTAAVAGSSASTALAAAAAVGGFSTLQSSLTPHQPVQDVKEEPMFEVEEPVAGISSSNSITTHAQPVVVNHEQQ
jgi:hypothetical protein